ncbi:MAG: hypothetical protein ACF8LL_07815 [Phycisphaerales bacterium]
MNGRPWSCTANAEHIDIRFQSIRSLPALRASARAAAGLLHHARGLSTQPIKLKLGPLPQIRLNHAPGILERLLYAPR